MNANYSHKLHFVWRVSVNQSLYPAVYNFLVRNFHHMMKDAFDHFYGFIINYI